MNKKKKILIVCFLVLISIISLTNFNFDPDYYWHISAGKYMVNHKFILTHDVFSWSVPSIYWTSHEWLFEVIIYKLSLLFPKTHAILYSFIGVFTLLLTIFLTNKEKCLKNLNFTCFWFIIFIMISMGVICPRPYMISNVLFALTLYLLFTTKDNEFSNKIYFLPLISILWSNVHGGSSNLSYILILIFIFTGLFDFELGNLKFVKNTKLQNKKYLIVLILCILTICINPHGIKMLTYPYENMQDSFMLKTINEWQPTNFNKKQDLIYLGSLLFTLFTLIISKKKITFLDLTIILSFIFLGFKSVRFWSLSYIASTYVVFNYINEYKVSNKDLKAYCFFIILIIIFSVSMIITKYPKLKDKVTKKMLSDKIIIYLQKDNCQRLYNYYDYGGYLISKNIKVFIDGRADLYSNYNYKDYYNLSFLNNDYEKIINKYKFDCFVIPKKIPLAYYLKKNDNYNKVVATKKIIIYKKDAS